MLFFCSATATASYARGFGPERKNSLIPATSRPTATKPITGSIMSPKGIKGRLSLCRLLSRKAIYKRLQIRIRKKMRDGEKKRVPVSSPSSVSTVFSDSFGLWTGHHMGSSERR